MAQGQMQLAMEKKEERKDRDVRAIRWLINNLTEDAEMEQFIVAIPGSFDTDWGREVWKRIGKHEESVGQSQDEPFARPHRDTTAHQPSSSWSIGSILKPIIHLVRNPAPRHPPTDATTRPPDSHNVHSHSTTAHILGENAVYELSTRIARTVEICKNHKLSSNNDDLWRKRTRACIEVTALLVFRANARLAWFGGISKLLGDIGSFEEIRELSVVGMDQLFVTHWTCLSLMAIRLILVEKWNVQVPVKWAIGHFANEDDTGNHDALETAQKIDKTLLEASDCLNRLFKVLHKTEDLAEVKEILGGHESKISKLEQLKIEADRSEKADDAIFRMQRGLNDHSHRIISQFPGVFDDFDLDNRAPIPFSRLVELSRDPHKLQFIRPGETLKSMCSPSVTLRNILEGQGDSDAYKELLKNLEIFTWQGDEMQRQLWRLQDLSCGGLGFTVELFFLALKQLLSTSSNGSHSTLYAGTFRAITSDWRDHKHSLGTQKLLLYIAKTHLREFVDRDYPSCIADEFLLLLGNVFEGQTGPHIERARRQFEIRGFYGEFRAGVLIALSGMGARQARSLASSS